MQNLQSKQTGQWRWINTQGGKYLQAEALRKQGLVHGFFTKEWNNQSPKQIVNSLDRSFSVHTCKQVHGATVIEASKSFQSHLPEADGLISDQKNQSLWICTADCIPILLADPINSIVGAIHAGWKGLSKHILSEAIRRMEYLGADKSKLIIALGPSISKANYQVDFHVAESIYTSKSNENELKFVRSKNKIQNFSFFYTRICKNFFFKNFVL